jgi:hypothetical protein
MSSIQVPPFSPLRKVKEREGEQVFPQAGIEKE